MGVASTDIGVNPSKPRWLVERMEVKLPSRTLATGVVSAEHACINRTRGPRRGKLFEPQPLPGVPGQKFTGVVGATGEINGEATGVAPGLCAQKRGAALRSGAPGQENVR